jgi:hypothetical protein
MAPAFCPRCIRNNQWLEELRNERKAVAERKTLARRFFWIRRRGKGKAGDGGENV